MIYTLNACLMYHKILVYRLYITLFVIYFKLNLKDFYREKDEYFYSLVKLSVGMTLTCGIVRKLTVPYLIFTILICSTIYQKFKSCRNVFIFVNFITFYAIDKYLHNTIACEKSLFAV